MALVCDWLLPQQSRKREAALLQQIQQDRRKRMIITQQLAQEALTRMQSRDGCNRLAYHVINLVSSSSSSGKKKTNFDF